MMLELTIYIVPAPWKRMGFNRKMGHFYTRKKVSDFQAAIRAEWSRKYGGRAPMRGPVRLEVLFIMPRPKRMIWKTKPMPRVPHIQTPDADNLIKNIKDALNRIAWADDKLIYDEHSQKYWAAGDEAPHIQLKVWED
jgi:Holliday junction resolvase RusA-like endonuclease